MKVSVQQDRGWAWVALAGAFLSNTICALYTLPGVYHVIFLEVFAESATMTSWLVGIHSALVSLLGPVSSIIMNRHGPRITLIIAGTISTSGFVLTFFAPSFMFVFICYGLMAGIGLGIAYTCSTTVPSLYFNKYRLLANGISVAGIAVGTLSLAPLVRIATDYYGWRGSMLIVAGINFNLMVGAIVLWPVNFYSAPVEIVVEKDTYDPLPKDPKDATYISTDNGESIVNISYTKSYACTTTTSARKIQPKKKKNFDIEIFKNIDFVGYCIALVFMNISIAIYLTFMPSIAMAHGTSALAAANLIAWGSISGIFARIGLGVFGNFVYVHEITLNIVFCVISATCLMAVPYLSQWYGGQLATCLLFGMFGVCIYVIMPATCIAILGADSVCSAVGTGSFMYGIGYLIGPPLGGILYDFTRVHNYTFYVSGVSYLIAGLIMSLLHARMKKSVPTD